MNRLARLIGALAVTVASAGVAGAQDSRMLAMAAQVEAGQAAQMAANTLAAQKLELAKTILAERQAVQREPLAPWFTAFWTDRLTRLSVSQLQSLIWAGPSADMAGTVASMSVSASADAASADAGSTGGDLTYTKIQPCRAADTRYAVGALGNGSTRNFYVAGGAADAALFTGQGGNPCGVPFGATSVAVNITVVYTSGPGWLRAYPFDPADPTGVSATASIINYVAGDIIANGLILPICDPAAATCTSDLTLAADAAGTHVIVDVMGYFAPKLGTRKTFTVESFTGGPAKSTVIPLAGCVNFNGGSVTITVPGPGEILVSGKSVVLVKHVVGQTDLVQVGLNTSPTNCDLTSPGFTWGNGVYQYIDAGQPTPAIGAGLTLWQDTTLRYVVSSVSGGTYTFYLNGYREAGALSSFEWAGLKATFHPQ